jgi:hypothetical protein
VLVANPGGKPFGASLALLAIIAPIGLLAALRLPKPSAASVALSGQA